MVDTLLPVFSFPEILPEPDSQNVLGAECHVGRSSRLCGFRCAKHLDGCLEFSTCADS